MEDKAKAPDAAWEQNKDWIALASTSSPVIRFTIKGYFFKVKNTIINWIFKVPNGVDVACALM